MLTGPATEVPRNSGHPRWTIQPRKPAAQVSPTTAPLTTRGRADSFATLAVLIGS